MEKKSDFGLIGLAVMGQNLVLNVESRGFQVSVYNRTTATMTKFIEENPDKQLVGCESLEEFVESSLFDSAIICLLAAPSLELGPMGIYWESPCVGRPL